MVRQLCAVAVGCLGRLPVHDCFANNLSFLLCLKFLLVLWSASSKRQLCVSVLSLLICQYPQTASEPVSAVDSHVSFLLFWQLNDFPGDISCWLYKYPSPAVVEYPFRCWLLSYSTLQYHTSAAVSVSSVDCCVNILKQAAVSVSSLAAVSVSSVVLQQFSLMAAMYSTFANGCVSIL
jgi:hypothetical protein